MLIVDKNCGGWITAPSGVIQSPNYPGDYGASDDCRWFIQVPQNHIVQLQFLDFDVEPGTNCSYDHVAVSPKYLFNGVKALYLNLYIFSMLFFKLEIIRKKISAIKYFIIILIHK